MTIKIPGTAVGEVPKNLTQFAPPKALRELPGRDPASVQCFQASVHDGVLSIIVSHDGGMWHISVAHRAGWGDGGKEILTRLPTWDELKWAKYGLVPVDVPMTLDFPRSTDPYVNVHETCLHLWEVPDAQVRP